jgi:hypothetical protein
MTLQLPYIFRPHKVIKLIFKVHCTLLRPMSIDILDILKRKNYFMLIFDLKKIIFPLYDAKLSKGQASHC